MTRKESGWVSEAMGLIGAYCQECAAQPDANARKQRESLNAINSHLTSLQSVSEWLEEALVEFLKAQVDLDNREYAGVNAEDYFVLLRRRNAARHDLDAALAAFQAIKEK